MKRIHIHWRGLIHKLGRSAWVLALVAAFGNTQAAAQQAAYPSKPVVMVVPNAAGTPQLGRGPLERWVARRSFALMRTTSWSTASAGAPAAVPTLEPVVL